MAYFFNQASLIFAGRRSNSNITQNEIVDVINLTKTAISQNYSQNSGIVYAVSIVNSGVSNADGITLTDNLGAYEISGNTIYPLDYVEGSIKYYVDGVEATAPTVTVGPPLTISGISVPAQSNALIIFEARTNEFTPLAQGSSVTNEISSQGGEYCSALVGRATVPVAEEALPVITKCSSDETVVCGGTLSYTFILQNLGNTPVVATDNLIVEDVFNPILNISSVTLNGTELVLGTGYSYNETTGEFATLPGAITIPAASYEQNSETGVITTTPGVTILTVNGSVS